MLNMDTLTHKSQQCVQSALSLAQEHGHQELSTWHFLHALVGDSETAITPLLNSANISVSDIQKECESRLKKKPKVSGSTQPYLSTALNALFTETKKMLLIK